MMGMTDEIAVFATAVSKSIYGLDKQLAVWCSSTTSVDQILDYFFQATFGKSINVDCLIVVNEYTQSKYLNMLKTLINEVNERASQTDHDQEENVQVTVNVIVV